MNPEQLIPGEHLLHYSDNGLITVTTHRVRYWSDSGGQSDCISMMLEKISSMRVLYISYPYLLGIGAVLAGIGLIMMFQQRSGDGLIPLALGVAAVIAYYGTRKHVCIIASDGGDKIVFKTEGMDTDSVITMVDKIELAKSNGVARL